MTDEKIVDLYWERSEDAIKETSNKYGKLCNLVAYNILRSDSDAEECVNDTYLGAWNSMPTARPSNLMAYICRITRNIALNMWKSSNRQKRGGGQVELVINELSMCVSGDDSPEFVVEKLVFDDVLNTFLRELTRENRDIFLARYWYMYTPEEIAKKFDITENNVAVSLFRSRKKLKKMMQKEGLDL